MNGLTLDTGALIAFDRGERKINLLLDRARANELPIVVPAGVVAQAWRDGRRQVRLARLLAVAEVDIVPLDDLRARAAGQLCGVRKTSDVVDASVVLCARAHRYAIVTSDPDDIRHLDSKVEIIPI